MLMRVMLLQEADQNCRPVYVSELAQPSKRGRVVGAQQWAITWGVRSSPPIEDVQY
jgi:hypothetical protein